MTYVKPSHVLHLDATVASCCTGGGVNNNALNTATGAAANTMNKIVAGGACLIPLFQ